MRDYHCQTQCLSPVTVPVVADHPFVYAIRERSSGAVLFVGVFAHPTQ